MSKYVYKRKLYTIYIINKYYQIYIYITINTILYNMITNTLDETLTEMNMMLSWSEQTYKLYKFMLQKYIDFNMVSFEELIQEAETDEENINKLSKRRIKKRLIKYQIYLQQQDKTPNTIKGYMSAVMKVYKYMDIEVPKLPTIKNNIIETYDDLPTKEEIKKAVLHSRIKMKAIITFIASSGLRRSDVASLTVGDFFKATHDYHKANNVLEMIVQLEKRDVVVPEWHITSEKTNVTHITFSSNESSMYILQMLKERILVESVNLVDSLFNIQKETITRNFITLNTRLGYGWKQTRRKFHPHALRKYFATTLTTNDVDFLTTEFLIGHTLPSVQSSYYYANPNKLKNKYMRIMKHLTFTMEVSFIDIDSKEKRELKELRQFKLESSERIRKLEEVVNRMPEI